MTDHPLGRLTPTDFEHVDKYPYAALGLPTIELASRTLTLPGWLASHDQGREGSCVGHGIVLERAVTNAMQKKAAGVYPFSRYDPIDVWDRAKTLDEWDVTNPGDNNGTSVRAGYQGCRDAGLRPVHRMTLENGIPTPGGESDLSLEWGVTVYRWATTVDEVRTVLAAGQAVVIGTNWYTGFDKPTRGTRSYWLPNVETAAGLAALGTIRGGHCVTLTAVSDTRQAFKLINSWGRSYPAVWLPYPTLERLLTEDGEVALVTDR